MTFSSFQLRKADNVAAYRAIRYKSAGQILKNIIQKSASVGRYSFTLFFTVSPLRAFHSYPWQLLVTTNYF
jgi:hypothetical protein